MRNTLFIIGFIILTIVAVYAALKSQEAKQECLDSGGWINKYNCGSEGCANWSCIHD